MIKSDNNELVITQYIFRRFYDIYWVDYDIYLWVLLECAGVCTKHKKNKWWL